MLRRSDTSDEGRSENESRIWKLQLRMQKSRMTRSKLFHVLYCCTRVRHTKKYFFQFTQEESSHESTSYLVYELWYCIHHWLCPVRTLSLLYNSFNFKRSQVLPRHTIIHRRNKSKKQHIRQKARNLNPPNMTPYPRYAATLPSQWH